MVEELPLSPIRAASPFPVPASRPSIPSASRRRHRSYAQGRLLDVELVSEEECHSLPASLPATSVDTLSLARRAGQSRRTVRSGGRQGLLRSSGDVSLMDVISRMKLLEQVGSTAPRTISGVGEKRRRERIERGILIRVELSILVDASYRFPFSEIEALGEVLQLRRQLFYNAPHPLCAYYVITEEAYCCMRGFIRHLGHLP